MPDKLPESRRPDPFRRQPPTIDGKAQPVASSRSAGPPTSSSSKTSTAVPGSAKASATPSAGPKAADPAPSPSPAGKTAAGTAAPREARLDSPKPAPPADPLAGVAAKAARVPISAVIGSAVLGGIVGAGLTVGLDKFFPAPGGTSVDTRVAALERRVSSAQAPDASLAARVAALEEARRTAASLPANAAAPRVDALDGRVKALEEASRQGSTGRSDNAGAIEDLRRQLADAAKRADGAARQAGAGAQANATALAELTARVTAQGGQAAQQAQAQTSALGAMQARLGDVDKRLGAVDAAFTRFGPDTAQAGLRVVVAQRLDAALRSGQPLGSTVATLARLGASPATIDALKPFVETGAPSLASLAGEFRPLGDRTIEASRGPAASVGDRLLRMAERIVTVRKVGEGGAGDVSDIVATVEAALARGDADAAATAWDRLPEASKSISADWAKRLKARAAAGAAANRVGSDALASIDAALR